MTSLAAVASTARQLCRDFGIFFEATFADAGNMLKLPHPLVDPKIFSVTDNDGGAATEDYLLNARNGLLRLNTPSAFPTGVTVSGIHYQWFLDEDLEFYAQMIATEHLHHRSGVTLESIQGAEIEVMGIGAVLMGYWSLLAEFATDIDVSQPEGMNIPAHQRFAQVQNLIQLWEKRYDEKAAMLNVGLNRMEMFDLRRISRLTNRYVPMYRGREIDNPRPPIRVRPPIDPMEPTPFEDEEAYWADQGTVTTESFDFGYGGWGTIGTGGAP